MEEIHLKMNDTKNKLNSNNPFKIYERNSLLKMKTQNSFNFLKSITLKSTDPKKSNSKYPHKIM